MSAGDEWGPWIEHDGKGCPVKQGQYVAVIREEMPGILNEFEGVVGPASFEPFNGWEWRYWGRVDPNDGYASSRFLRYRVRRPRGLTILQQLIEDLPAPAPVREREDA